jgi:acyl carrier protein
MTPPPSPPVAEAVVEILKDVSRRPIEPTPASDLIADLGFDSLQVMETIAGLEDRFDISIPAEDVPNVRTVAQVVSSVEALLEARRPSR